ncbi:hypothetical protein [Streptomyces sp. WAC06128]|uniref:hypothetical protein n=1 Tax=Streptomyces sp. WAC06128 TaxID=2487426 RepID=UPI000FA1F05A|nr:hypothetical protein [Streptomyces sp. WAC06128]RSS67621.1 hypothetical protein EF911_34270 [Streptomyces sp. WAC06128]
MSDGSKTNDTDNTSDEPEGRMARLRRRLSEWQIQQQVARGLAYGVSSNAVSLIVLWAKSSGLGS